VNKKTPEHMKQGHTLNTHQTFKLSGYIIRP